MLLRLPQDPAEKWKTVRSALDDCAKTRRLCLIVIVSSIPLTLVLITVIVLALTHAQWT